MVDINLIGDDKTGEEERVEDFTQTSSMDTQELAFEERTETFDTTKTTGFARKRSYSSLVSTLIIIVAVVLLAGAIYFFVLGDDPAQQEDMMTYTEPAQEPAETAPAEEDPSASNFDEESFFEDIENGNSEPLTEEQQPAQMPAEREPVAESPPEETTSPPPSRSTQPETTTPPPTRSRSTVSSLPVALNTSEAVETVSSMIGSVPSGLNATLLSYSGERVRFEFVASSGADARNFTDQLGQFFGAGNYSVVSESQVANNGQSMEKVLISGRLPTGGASNSGATVMSLAETKEWFSSTCSQFGLTLREVSSQPAIRSGRYDKTPVLVRVYGAQSSIISFLREIAAENLNLEIAKILLVSPDMVTYSDDNLVLVMNLFLYEPS